jgi:hypothetical protein
MRVYLKMKNHRNYNLPIPVPMFIFRLGLSSFIKRQIILHCDNATRKYLEGIDFDAIYGSIRDLKAYKGLKLVEVKAGDGTEVTVIV